VVNDTTRLLGLDGMAVTGAAAGPDAPVVHLPSLMGRDGTARTVAPLARRSKGRRVTPAT
jgi:hypothetical protein